MRSQFYKCPTCGATKEIEAHPTQTTEKFIQQLPDDLPCGFRGCNDRAVPAIKKENDGNH